MTRRCIGQSMTEVISKLSVYLRGWYGYFGITQEQYRMQNLDSWIRRRLRSLQLNQWRHGRVIYQRLRAIGINDRQSRGVAQYAGRWGMANGPPRQLRVTESLLHQAGAVLSIQEVAPHFLNRPVRTRTPGGVAGSGQSLWLAAPMPMSLRRPPAWTACRFRGTSALTNQYHCEVMAVSGGATLTSAPPGHLLPTDRQATGLPVSPFGRPRGPLPPCGRGE
jgi:hypothetical protein